MLFGKNKKKKKTANSQKNVERTEYSQAEYEETTETPEDNNVFDEDDIQDNELDNEIVSETAVNIEELELPKDVVALLRNSFFVAGTDSSMDEEICKLSRDEMLERLLELKGIYGAGEYIRFLYDTLYAGSNTTDNHSDNKYDYSPEEEEESNSDDSGYEGDNISENTAIDKEVVMEIESEDESEEELMDEEDINEHEQNNFDMGEDDSVEFKTDDMDKEETNIDSEELSATEDADDSIEFVEDDNIAENTDADELVFEEDTENISEEESSEEDTGNISEPGYDEEGDNILLKVIDYKNVSHKYLLTELTEDEDFELLNMLVEENMEQHIVDFEQYLADAGAVIEDGEEYDDEDVYVVYDANTNTIS